jgi:hypothetical protein
MQQNDEEYEGEWYPYEEGITINQTGPAGGYVLRDEELGDPEETEDADARLTLEQGRATAPGFYVTATLYGWMYHTHRTDTAEQGEAAYTETRAELEKMALLIPYEEDGAKNVEKKAALLLAAITTFEGRFP